MTEKDKKLLMNDLYARLQYGVKMKAYEPLYGYDITVIPHSLLDLDCFDCHTEDFKYEQSFGLENITPYLRPISSMTEEETDMLFNILHIDKDGKDDDWIKINDEGIKFFFPTGKWIENVIEAYDYLNSIHIDYRGLIAKKLVLEAPEGIYNLNKNIPEEEKAQI